jgi:hypothetical protein
MDLLEKLGAAGVCPASFTMSDTYLDFFVLFQLLSYLSDCP